MFYYTAYGLTIRSELVLADLLEIPAALDIDVDVRRGEVPRPVGHEPMADRAFTATPQEAVMYWRRAGLFAVRDGHDIVVDAPADVEAWLIGLVVGGPALGVVLHQRGTLALHASAVTIDGEVAAFLGDSGQGKSTTAAAFHSASYPLICDDVVALDAGLDRPMVFPALPRIKLYPHAAAALGYDSHLLHVFDSADVRRGYHLRDLFSRHALPLGGLFVLTEGPQCRVERMTLRDAFLQLTRHSYALRFVGTSGTNALHFRQCEQLVRQVPIWRLERPRSFDQLPEIIQFVAEHMRQQVVA